MTTAVDTCVLLDLLLGEAGREERAEAALRHAFGQGALVVCEVVYAELMPQFDSADELDATLAGLGVSFAACSVHTAALAGNAWGEYRRRGGPRQRVVADFLVGAHALTMADRLLTRDKGFYHRSFPRLAIIEP